MIRSGSEHHECAFYLAFKRGALPDRRALIRMIAKLPNLLISHDPSDSPNLRLVETNAQEPTPISPHSWIEILSQGLTYDLEGFAPGSPCKVPQVDHLFDTHSHFSAAALNALCIRPGANIAGGAKTMPVLRGMTYLACALAREFSGLDAVIWPPAHSAMGRKYFESTAMAWLEGGAFPAIGFTAFTLTADGEVESVGLSHWTGQELRVEKSAALDKVAATRLAARLVDQLVVAGRVVDRLEFTGPDGTRLTLEPINDDRFLRVIRG